MSQSGVELVQRGGLDGRWKWEGGHICQCWGTRNWAWARCWSVRPMQLGWDSTGAEKRNLDVGWTYTATWYKPVSRQSTGAPQPRHLRWQLRATWRACWRVGHQGETIRLPQITRERRQRRRTPLESIVFYPRGRTQTTLGQRGTGRSSTIVYPEACGGRLCQKQPTGPEWVVRSHFPHQ